VINASKVLIMCPNCTLLAKADFEPFVWTDHTGRTRFANRMSGGNRFLDRTWPVFRRVPRRTYRRPVVSSPCEQKVNQSILKSSQVTAARRWIPMNPLAVHQMRVEDALVR
jgi:hypothetical protein